MAISKKNITGTTPADIKNINDNMNALWYKLFGNLSLGDINNEFLDKVLTQYTTVQEEGNLDSTHPLYVRFYIPPNTKKILSAPFNIMLSRYRMDSSITMGGGGVNNVDVAASTVAQKVTASVASTVATAKATSYEREVKTSTIKYWQGDTFTSNPPTMYYPANEKPTAINKYIMAYIANGKIALGLRVAQHDDGYSFIDFNNLFHEHSIEIPGHSHSISIEPHGHSINIEPHTHEITAKVNIQPHTHDLAEGIKDSVEQPRGVNVYVNDKAVVTNLSGDSTVVNDVDIAEHLLIGSWNTIRVTSQNVSRVTLYGIIELVSKFNTSKR